MEQATLIETLRKVLARTESLVADAAEAVESIPEDELEAHAATLNRIVDVLREELADMLAVKEDVEAEVGMVHNDGDRERFLRELAIRIMKEV